MQSKEKKILKNILFGLIIFIVVSFSVFQSKNLITGPKIKVVSPINGQIAEESLIKVTGITKNISEIKLNGRNIFVDEKGVFNERVLLSYGYNTITLEGKDRFNREIKEELELVLK
jgi:hypothetical protein